MKVFSLFGKKNKKLTETPETSTIGKRFVLYSTPLGWDSCVQRENGALEGLRSEVDIPVEGEGWKRTEAVIKAAVVANAGSIKKAKTITLLLDDFSVQVVDNKPMVLIAASGAIARQYGRQWLNVKDVSYGYADLSPITGKLKKRNSDGVYAFIDAQRMRDYLALLDRNGVKVTEAIPKEYILIHRAMQSSEPVYGCFQMSGHTSTLLLINHALGIVQVRKIPVGFMTLVKAIAEKMGVPTPDAIQVMAHKNLVDEIVPLMPHDLENKVPMHDRSLQFQALQPPLTRLLEDIKEFLAFFVFQKVAGMPKRLELFGAVGRVMGLTEWLDKHAAIPMVVCKESILELFAQMEHPVGCNLLKGAESSLLTVGKTSFFFTEDKGFVSSQELAIRNTPVLVKSSESAASFAKTGSSTKDRDRGSGRRKIKEKTDRDGRRSGGELADLLARLHISRRTNTNTLPDLEKNTNDQKFVAVFILFLLILLYWGYSEHASIAKIYQRQALIYLNIVDENNSLLKQLETQEASTRKMAAAIDTTKIFWSEKFLALASNMDEHTWLTDVYLSEDERNVAGAKVKSKTMVIEGRLLPSTDGHIRIISKYIDNLLNDSKWFMSDFRDVVFHGAEIEGDPANMSADPKIHFVLRAFYDKNKRVGNKKGSDRQEEGLAGLGEMHENVNQHNQQSEDALHGNIRR